MISTLGAGLLVGTALAVIIPEGVHALYESEEHGKNAFLKFIAGSSGEQLTILDVSDPCDLNSARMKVDFRISLDELRVHMPSGFQC